MRQRKQQRGGTQIQWRVIEGDDEAKSEVSVSENEPALKETVETQTPKNAQKKKSSDSIH